MKTNLTKRVLVIALALVMVFSFAACGSEDKEMTMEEILTTALETMNEAESMSYDMIMEMEFTAEDQTIQMNMKGVADYFVSPLKMKMDMVMDMGELGSYDMDMYAIHENDQLISYTGMDLGTGMTWTSSVLEDADALMQYNAQESMEMYISNAESFVANGEEEINGSMATRYDGVITEESMEEVLASSGIFDQTASLGVTEEDLKNMVSDLGNLPITLYIDNETYMPVKYEMDMTEMMQTIMDKTMEAAGEEAGVITIGKVTMSMTVYNVNSATDFDIPEEAKTNATPI